MTRDKKLVNPTEFAISFHRMNSPGREVILWKEMLPRPSLHVSSSCQQTECKHTISQLGIALESTVALLYSEHHCRGHSASDMHSKSICCVPTGDTDVRLGWGVCGGGAEEGEGQMRGLLHDASGCPACDTLRPARTTAGSASTPACTSVWVSQSERDQATFWRQWAVTVLNCNIIDHLYLSHFVYKTWNATPHHNQPPTDTIAM